jgi:hypothetical protein
MATRARLGARPAPLLTDVAAPACADVLPGTEVLSGVDLLATAAVLAFATVAAATDAPIRVNAATKLAAKRWVVPRGVLITARQ